MNTSSKRAPQNSVSFAERRAAARTWLALPLNFRAHYPMPVVYKNKERNLRSLKNIAKLWDYPPP